MTDKTVSFPLFPGAATPEGQARIAKAVKTLEENAARCRLVLRDILDEMSPGSVRPDLREDAVELINQWHECSDELLNAVAGRNPK